MGFWDKLSSLLESFADIKLPFSQLKELNIKININSFNKTNPERKPILIDETTETLHFFPNHISQHISPEKEKEFIELLKLYREERGKLVSAKKNSLLNCLYEFTKEESKEDQEILIFFNNKIPHKDYLVLRDSLFLRREFFIKKKSPGTITSYKLDIRNRFGIRGVNIANLCTAGYFEKLIMPLFGEHSKEDFEYYYC